jgi:hypothetical protein
MTNVTAQEIKFPTIGVGSGVIFPQNQWDPGYFFDLQCEIGEMLDYVFIVPYVSFWNAQKTEKGLTEMIDLNLSQINFGSEFFGYLNQEPKGLFTGIGIGYHVIYADELAPEYFNQEPQVKETTETKLSFAALVGYQIKYLNFSCALKLKYYLINGGYNTFQTGLVFSYTL